MDINEILNSPFTFTRRKNFTPCDTRPLWKCCLIVLILGITGKSNSASLKKIHTANWITKKEEHLSSFLIWGGQESKKRPNVRLEPAIDRVLNILVSNEIAIKTEGNISLTQLGIDLFTKLNEEDIFQNEKIALAQAKKHLSEASVKRLFEGV